MSARYLTPLAVAVAVATAVTGCRALPRVQTESILDEVAHRELAAQIWDVRSGRVESVLERVVFSFAGADWEFLVVYVPESADGAAMRVLSDMGATEFAAHADQDAVEVETSCPYLPDALFVSLFEDHRLVYSGEQGAERYGRDSDTGEPCLFTEESVFRVRGETIVIDRIVGSQVHATVEVAGRQSLPQPTAFEVVGHGMGYHAWVNVLESSGRTVGEDAP